MECLVSECDYEMLSQYHWRYTYNAKDMTGYACTSYIETDENGVKRRVHKRMHRMILNTPDDLEVDHINGNGLDNQRENIVNCTHAENIQSRKGRSVDFRHWLKEVS